MHPASTRRLLEVEALASRGVVLTGSVEPASMPRLLEVVAEPSAPIAYRIAFARDAAGRPGMAGRVEGTLPLVCQRCLDRLDWSFDARFESLLVGDEREDTDGQDAVVCPGGRIALEPVIEDELLLALPGAPVHARGSCEAPPVRAAGGAPPARPPSPFSILRTLRSGHGRGRSS